MTVAGAACLSTDEASKGAAEQTGGAVDAGGVGGADGRAPQAALNSAVNQTKRYD
jgi:hypothetical protein